VKAFQWFSWIVGLYLLVRVISSLVPEYFKRFPFLLAYCVALFLGTVVAISSRVDQGFSRSRLNFSETTARYYWITDAVLQFLVFCIVISLIHQSLEHSPQRARVGRWLIAGALIVTGASLWLHRADTLSGWMTLVSRDLNFTAVLLNIVLWFTLISSPKRNTRLLMVSGALGIQFAGTAIGHSLRQFGQAVVPFGNVILVLSNLVCLYIWWQTFRLASAAVNPGRSEGDSRHFP
jgi:hypothetical protein